MGTPWLTSWLAWECRRSWRRTLGQPGGPEDASQRLAQSSPSWGRPWRFCPEDGGEALWLDSGAYVSESRDGRRFALAWFGCPSCARLWPQLLAVPPPG
jgi:hypothetical protein